MTSGIEISESDFKQYNLKEQNVIIFKNLLEVKMDVRKFQDTNVIDHKKIKSWSIRAILISTGAIALTVIVLGFLFQHINQTALSGG
jgi:hypothetical protein